MVNITEKRYRYLLYVSYFFYIISFLGISFIAPKYHKILVEIIKIYVCLILIRRFNPISHKKCSTFDKELAFSAACFLLLTTIIGELAVYITKNLTIDVINDV